MRIPDVVFVVLLCLDFVAIGTNALDCTGGRMVGQYICLKKGDYPTRQTNAEAICNRDGGKLVGIGDKSKQEILKEMMNDEKINDVWIGLTDKPSDIWMWATSQSEIKPQGCFTDRDSGNRDLPHSSGLPADQVSIDTCSEKCKQKSWRYAGTQSGFQCWCGNSFGNNGNYLITDCRVTCQGNALQYCGGSYKNYIYRTDGAYGIWMQSQPNNHDGHQWCGAMDSSADYKFADEPCDRQVHFICNMPANTACNRVVNNGRLIGDADYCYFLSYVLKNWFGAQKDCWERGGHLLELESAKEHEKLAKEITSFSKKLSQYYWIGLQRRYLNWPDGSIMTYSNFKSGSPSGNTGMCFKVTKSDEYQWVEVECSERHEFICQYELHKESVETTTLVSTTEQYTTDIISDITDISTTLSITSSSSSTSENTSTVPLTTLPTTAATTSATTNSISSTRTTIKGLTTSFVSTASTPLTTAVHVITPSAAAKSTDEEDFDYNALFISLIVLVSILIIIVIAAILYMVYLRKKNKNKNQAVHPSRSYDVNDFENKYLSSPKTVTESNPYSSIHPSSTGMKPHQGHVSDGKIMIDD